MKGYDQPQNFHIDANQPDLYIVPASTQLKSSFSHYRLIHQELTYRGPGPVCTVFTKSRTWFSIIVVRDDSSQDSG
ncbi:hypothetical protein [Ktedonobacter racemifer]|uniref:Uncharacterized protein n=1 Tax=Ktedonobacter racemifer DSM 44963 TaxID=485913 RepID=D6TGD8_KTERA|nr:hypothetical protein [Ktedonobacter racemifer]EFH90650.1 conserved hypothetical protein [Ktedonobacter racemifer DSM 44963]